MKATVLTESSSFLFILLLLYAPWLATDTSQIVVVPLFLIVPIFCYIQVLFDSENHLKYIAIVTEEELKKTTKDLLY